MHVSGTGKHVCLSTSQTLGGGEHRPSQMKVAPRPQQLPGEVRGAQSGWSSPSPVRPPPQDEHVDVGSPENASWGANQYPDGDRASLLPLEPTRRQGGASATPGFAHSPSRRSVPQGRPGERSLMLTQTTPASPDAVPKGNSSRSSAHQVPGVQASPCRGPFHWVSDTPDFCLAAKRGW